MRSPPLTRSANAPRARAPPAFPPASDRSALWLWACPPPMQALALDPKKAPYLWQRGMALFLDGTRRPARERARRAPHRASPPRVRPTRAPPSCLRRPVQGGGGAVRDGPGGEQPRHRGDALADHGRRGRRRPRDRPQGRGAGTPPPPARAARRAHSPARPEPVAVAARRLFRTTPGARGGQAQRHARAHARAAGALCGPRHAGASAAGRPRWACTPPPLPNPHTLLTTTRRATLPTCPRSGGPRRVGGHAGEPDVLRALLSGRLLRGRQGLRQGADVHAAGAPLPDVGLHGRAGQGARARARCARGLSRARGHEPPHRRRTAARAGRRTDARDARRRLQLPARHSRCGPRAPPPQSQGGRGPPLTDATRAHRPRRVGGCGGALQGAGS